MTEVAAEPLPGEAPGGEASSFQGRVTVSVISHGHGALLDRLLEDLRHGAEAIEEIVVTLNLPQDAEPAVPDALRTRTRTVRNAQPLGFAANHNRAFASCRTEWFAVVNPDVRLRGDPWTGLLSAAAPDDGALAPKVIDAEGRAEDSIRSLITPWQIALRSRRSARLRRPDQADWIAGMFLVVRAAAYRQIGGFDERYRVYCEDADLCLRLQLAGWWLRVVDRVAIVHEARRASSQSLRHLLWHLRSLVRHWASRPYREYRGAPRRQIRGE